jgi:hypothetical protein
MAREREEHLSTADIAAAADTNRQEAQRQPVPAMPRNEMDGGAQPKQEQQEQQEQLAQLFEPELAGEMRSRWTSIQSGFVDDPRRAVEQADELVAQALQDLARSFARHRQQIEADAHAGEGQPSTENLRVALRRYRSFFERLLSL